MVIRTGIIGFSDGNGHPLSFSAIINGYNFDHFKNADWPVILEYLECRDSSEFGIGEAIVTHAWCPTLKQTKLLCAACNIENACIDIKEMLGAVDAVIIARDDWQSHFEIALPFLKSGVFVFIDKPLSLSEEELKVFKPFLEAKKLMSCSGFRFASEFQIKDFDKVKLGKIRSIHGAVINGVEKYGIHLLDAINGMDLNLGHPIRVTRIKSESDAFLIEYQFGASFFLDCLGDVGKTFHLSVYGEKQSVQLDFFDNFGAFKNTLKCFFRMIQGSRAIEPAETLLTMKILSTMRNLNIGQSRKL